VAVNDSGESIVLPEKIRGFLVNRIEALWVGGGRDCRPVVDGLPRSLHAGRVERLVSGGPFGWLIDARLDEVDGRLALEVREDSRMAGPDHYRVWDDGSREALENERTMMVLPPNCSPVERRRIEDEYYAHNRAVGKVLKERGFV
jgi:hypothetical protein